MKNNFIPATRSIGHWYRWLCVIMLCMLAGCQQIHLQASMTPEANQDASGQPKPVELMIMELTQPGANLFKHAPFERVYQTPHSLLGDQLVQLRRTTLMPGELRKLSYHLQDQTEALGVLAALRNYQDQTWRAVLPIGQLARHTGKRVTLTITQQGIQLE